MSMRELREIIHPINGCIKTLTLFIDPYVESCLDDPQYSCKTVFEMMNREYEEQTEWTAPPSEAEGRARFMNCCFRLWAMIGPGNSDMFCLNWFVEALIDECSMSEQAMLRGQFPRHAWLWAALMARCAATSGFPSTSSEARQIQEWKRIACEKIVLVTRAENLRTWEATRALLRSWVWRDSFLDEQLIRDMWEEAVFGCKTEGENNFLRPTQLLLRT
jgi:hypothetical protein